MQMLQVLPWLKKTNQQKMTQQNLHMHVYQHIRINCYDACMHAFLQTRA